MLSSKNIKFLLVGGHLTPALAVLQELKKRGHSNFVWIGRKYTQDGDIRKSAEYKIIKNQNIKFYNLITGKLQRRWTRKNFLIGIKQLFLLPLGLLKALKIILKERPKIIISFGGYLALPVSFWGKLFGSKIVTHEQTITTGLANKWISKFADKILISWEESKNNFPPKKTILTGNPLRNEIFSTKTNNFNFFNDLPIIYVTGGSQGSNNINLCLFEIISKILKFANLIHQTGSSTVTNDYEKALKVKKKLPKKLYTNYIVREHIYGEEIGEVFNKASFIISRAGANTVTELLALGKPSILIPIPWSSNNEQYKNAQVLENIGLTSIITQQELNPDILYDKILSMLNSINNKMGVNQVPLELIKELAKNKVNLRASESIVNEIEHLIDIN